MPAAGSAPVRLTSAPLARCPSPLRRQLRYRSALAATMPCAPPFGRRTLDRPPLAGYKPGLARASLRAVRRGGLTMTEGSAGAVGAAAGQPRGSGDILSEAFDLYKKNAVLLIITAAVAMGPVYAIKDAFMAGRCPPPRTPGLGQAAHHQ